MGYACLVEDCNFESEYFNGRAQHMGLAHTTEEREPALIEELNRLAEELGRAPQARDLAEHARVGRDMYENVFGSWKKALDAAGYEPDYHQHTEEELLNEIRRLKENLGHTPRREEMEEAGKFGRNVFRERFGSWSEALKAAGLDPVEEKYLSREQLLAEIHDLADEMGRPPLLREMNSEKGYSGKRFSRVFGSWNDALKEAGYKPHVRRSITNEELLKELKNLADEFGRPPTVSEMDKEGNYWSPTYQSRFGSWNDALREAGLEPRVRGNGVRPLYGPGWNESKRTQIRDRDDFECQSCGLAESTHKDLYGSVLDVHHIRPAREFPDYHPRANVPKNLISLCIVCHKRWEESADLVPEEDDLPDYCEPADPSKAVQITDYTSGLDSDTEA